MQYKLVKKYVSERGKLTLVMGKKIIIALMVCPQEIIETLTLGYPRNGYSYPRNGKTTVSQFFCAYISRSTFSQEVIITESWINMEYLG